MKGPYQIVDRVASWRGDFGGVGAQYGAYAQPRDLVQLLQTRPKCMYFGVQQLYLGKLTFDERAPCGGAGRGGRGAHGGTRPWRRARARPWPRATRSRARQPPAPPSPPEPGARAGQWLQPGRERESSPERERARESARGAVSLGRGRSSPKPVNPRARVIWGARC